MKTMVIDGKHYIQVKQAADAKTYDCDLCAFNSLKCGPIALTAKDVFGGDCDDMGTFYEETEA